MLPRVALASSAALMRSLKVSTILPLADAPVDLSSGTLDTSLGATPSLTSFGVPVMKNMASVLPSFFDAEPSTFEVLSAIMRI